MNYVGGIDGMNFNPIASYNNVLKTSKAFEFDPSSMSFENVLNKQQAALQSPIQIQGGVQATNFDNVLNSVQGTSTSKNTIPTDSTGAFIQSFSNSVNGGLNSVNNNVNAANQAQEDLAMGKDVSVHDVMIASEKANLSMQLAMQLRNKLMSAYTEINNIKV